MSGWRAPGLIQVASAQPATGCYPAAAKGTDGPIDYGAYCWIDFPPLSLTLAKSASGQPFRVNLRGGAYLTFTLRVPNPTQARPNMYSVAVASCSRSPVGTSASNGIPGKPPLTQQQTHQQQPTT